MTRPSFIWSRMFLTKTISLNATYIVLFKNPRDMSQVSHLDKQVYPGGNGLLTAAYCDATSSRAHSYVVIDFNQSTPTNFACATPCLLMRNFRRHYLWTRLSGLRRWEEGPPPTPLLPHREAVTCCCCCWEGHKDCPVRLAASFAQTPSPWQQGTVQQESLPQQQ